MVYTVIAMNKISIYQGIIACTPKNKILSELISFIIQIHIEMVDNDYLIFTRHFYLVIKNDAKEVLPGLTKGIESDYYLFTEKCSRTNSSMCYDGFDIYGFCCFIWDKNEPVIKSRRSSYPWK